MLMIRLQRVGRRNDPSFRIVVTDKRNATRSGKFLEVLGSYDARQGSPAIDTERAKHWLGHGAQATGTVHNIFVDAGVVEGKKVDVAPPRPAKAEVKVEEAVAPEGEVPAQTSQEKKSAAPKEEEKEEAPAPETTAPASADVPVEKTSE